MKHKVSTILSSKSGSSMITVLVMLMLISSQCALLFQNTRRVIELAGLNATRQKASASMNNLLADGVYNYEKDGAVVLETNTYRSAPGLILSLVKDGQAYLIAKRAGVANFKIIGKLSE